MCETDLWPAKKYIHLPLEDFFASSQTSFRNQVLSWYPGFYRNLLNSPSREVRILARIVTDDPRSPTCANLKYLKEMTRLHQAQFFCDQSGTSSPTSSRKCKVETWPAHKPDESARGGTEQGDGGHQAHGGTNYWSSCCEEIHILNFLLGTIFFFMTTFYF